MFATFNKINTDLLWPSSIILVVILFLGLDDKYLDVWHWEETAINLGLNYNGLVKLFL